MLAIEEIKKELDTGSTVELECIDRDGFIGEHGINRSILETEKMIVKEIVLAGIKLTNDTPGIYTKELKYFRIKRSTPTFNDLIDVAVQAYKDKLIKRVNLNGDDLNVNFKAEDCLVGFNTSNSKEGSYQFQEYINDIKSLYKETFVIEGNEDMKALFAKNESIEITALNKSVFTYDDLGDLLAIDDKNLFKLLKGATVTQKRGAV